jgi:p-aminobenzoyl-glutamate transporter AbgT
MTQNNPDGLLGWIERSGNKLPDPCFYFRLLHLRCRWY